MNTVISQDGTPIAFDQFGQGPALVLVGGALQSRGGDPRTAALAERLAAHFTVVHYDRRGRGDSGDTTPYAVEHEVEDLEALIDALGGPAFVFGHSSGAVLALDAAQKLGPAKIARLALYEAPFVVDDSRPPRPDGYVERLDALVAQGEPGDAVAYMLTAGANVPAEYVAPMRAEPFWAGFETLAHTLAYDGRIMGDTQAGTPLPRERWASVVVPTLVMDGGASHPHMHGAAEALAALLPNATRRTLEGQDHGPVPEVLAPVLETFLQADVKENARA